FDPATVVAGHRARQGRSARPRAYSRPVFGPGSDAASVALAASSIMRPASFHACCTSEAYVSSEPLPARRPCRAVAANHSIFETVGTLIRFPFVLGARDAEHR